MEQLAELRAQIDQLDQELLQLLAKRLDVVHKVGEVKQRHGLPIYVPQREIEMLQRKREAAEQLGLSPDLIEDILRRIMRESYVSENRFGFKTVNPAIRKIVIVGGRGKLLRHNLDVCLGVILKVPVIPLWRWNKRIGHRQSTFCKRRML